MFRFIGIFIAGLCAGASALAASVEPGPQPSADARAIARASSTQPALTLGVALQRAFDQNPGLRGFGSARDAQAARAELYTLAPPLGLALQLENFAGTGELTALDGAETTLSLTGVLERGDKRRYREHLADAWRDRLAADQLVERLDLSAEVARRYLDAVSFQASRELHRESVAITAQTLAVVNTRMKAGKAGRAEVLRAELALNRARIEEAAAASGGDVARQALAGLWGDPTPDFDRLHGALLNLPEIPPYGTLVASLDNNPDLTALSSQSRIEEARERVAASARKVDLDWSVGVRRLEATNDQAFVVGISMPLGSSSRAAPAMREAAADRATVRWQSQAVRTSLESALYGAHTQLNQRRAEVATLIKDSLPRAREMLLLIEQGYASGRYSLLELADAQQQLLDVTAQTIASATGFHAVLIEIQRLTNEPIVNDFLGD